MDLLLIGLATYLFVLLIAHIISRFGEMEAALKVYKIELERLRKRVDSK